jgi:hypothetical protein
MSEDRQCRDCGWWYRDVRGGTLCKVTSAERDGDAVACEHFVAPACFLGNGCLRYGCADCHTTRCETYARFLDDPQMGYEHEQAMNEIARHEMGSDFGGGL